MVYLGGASAGLFLSHFPFRIHYGSGSALPCAGCCPLCDFGARRCTCCSPRSPVAAQAFASQPTAQTPPDAPFSVDKDYMEGAWTCPNGLTGKAIVLLVHGTGSAGAESWGPTPYHSLLPTEGEGFDICWVYSLRSDIFID